MYKKTVLTIASAFAVIFAGTRVSISDLDLRNGLWYLQQSEYPFNGIAYKLSKESGKIIQQINYIDGLEWGKYYEWWSDGTKKVDGKFRSGLMYGRWKFFNTSGKVFCAGSYLNGKGHRPPSIISEVPKEGMRGLWTYWNKDGRKIEEGYYSKNGAAKGNWSFWDKDGKKRLGKKINYKTFNNIDALKHLDGFFLVSGPINNDDKVYNKAHGAIRGGKLDGPWLYWNNDGQLILLKNFENGEPFGRFVSYYENGNIMSDGLVRGSDNSGNKLRDGKWTFWDKNGVLREVVQFNEGRREGLTKYFSITGKESAKIQYENDKPWSGEWVNWYHDGSLKESGLYQNGVREGSWKGWYENGQKKYVLQYQDNLKHGLYTAWSPSGRLTKDIEYNKGVSVSEYLVEYEGESYTEINRRNGELSGSWIKWYSNGKKHEEGVYKYGKKGGTWTGWFKNGIKKYQGKYIDGTLDGSYIEYDNKGNLIKNIIYSGGGIVSEYHISHDNSGKVEFHKKHGKLDGQWTRWYPNGNIAEEGHYKNGDRDGLWEGWYKSNKKYFSCNYENGNKVGTYKEWNKKGENIKKIDYINGKRISEYLVIKDGNGYMEINKLNGVLNGTWVKWYARGKKEEVGEYKDGLKIGTWSRFNILGHLMEEWNYDNQGRNLYGITYYKNGTVKEYRDYFSKTVQEYNIDGSKRGKTIPF